MRWGWQSGGAAGAGEGAGWSRALAFAGMLAGAAAALVWVLRERPRREPQASSLSPTPPPAPVSTPAAPSTAASPVDAPQPAVADPTTPLPPTLPPAPPAPPGEEAPAPEPAAVEATAGEARLSLTELWVLNGELHGTLANEGDATVSAVTWAMRLVPGYDADNDYGGEPPPVIEATGGHDEPIEVGSTAVVTLAEAPSWYLDVQLHPMQLRARYRAEDESGALQESEQSARLVLFHVRSEAELAAIREQYLG